MPGRRSSRARPAIRPGQDKTGAYEKACRALADEISWEPGAVCFVWSMIAEMRTKAGEPTWLAEYLAMRGHARGVVLSRS